MKRKAVQRSCLSKSHLNVLFAPDKEQVSTCHDFSKPVRVGLISGLWLHFLHQCSFVPDHTDGLKQDDVV